MSLSKRQQDFTGMVADLILFAQNNDMALTFGEVYRTREQQSIYVRTGFSSVSYSKHQDRLAVDFNLFIDGEYIRDREPYRALGEEWERLGGRWGGRFGVSSADYASNVGWDPGHFEYGG